MKILAVFDTANSMSCLSLTRTFLLMVLSFPWKYNIKYTNTVFVRVINGIFLALVQFLTKQSCQRETPTRKSALWHTGIFITFDLFKHDMLKNASNITFDTVNLAVKTSCLLLLCHAVGKLWITQLAPLTCPLQTCQSGVVFLLHTYSVIMFRSWKFRTR